MKKRFLAVLLSLIMIVSVLPCNIIPVYATSEVASVESTATLTVQQPWANPGGTVDVNLVISENPGILGATIVVSWDESMTLIEDASGVAFSHMTYTSPSRYTATGTNFVWFGNEVDEAVDGIALTLTFQVSEEVENNETLPVYVTYTQGDVIDGNDNDVTLSITDGYVRIITYKPGDVTGDNRVNSRDLVRLSQYISDGCTTDPDGYNAEIIADACDVNGDGRVNARDLIRLSQYISDGGQTNPDGYNAVLNPAKMPECTHFNIIKTDYKAPTCTETGVNEHWYCSECETYYSDEGATTKITFAETQIASQGHTVIVVEPQAPTYTEGGWQEWSYCSVCDEVIKEKVLLDPIPSEHGSITFNNLKTATISSEYTHYAKHEGMVLPTPQAEGYIFKGWYTEPDGNGTFVNKINADTDVNSGAPENYILYAHWELEVYDIIYDKYGNFENPLEYTIESPTIILKDAKLSGYIFDYWSDANGKIITSIPKGSTGDITLSTNWKSMRNLAVPVDELPNPEFKDTTIFDSSAGTYSFIYYLGEIQNVPLATVIGTTTYSGVASFDQTQSREISITSEYANSISKAVENATSQTQSWSHVEEWCQSKTNGRSTTHEVGFKFGLKDVWEISGGANTTTQWSKTTTTGWSNTNESIESYSRSDSEGYTTEFVYSEFASKTIQCTFSLSENSPSGNYRLVSTGTAHVFGAVTYNAITDSYNVWTFSILGECNEGLLVDYCAESSNFDDCIGELPFIIPDEVNEYVENLVQYSNGLKVTSYTDTDGQTKCVISRYTGTDTDVIIPSYYNGMMVTGISPSAFSDNTAITSITLGQYITSVPDNAFKGCTSLQTVNMPAVTSIGSEAFKGCTQLDISISNIVESIGDNAFDGCVALNNIVLSSNLTVLGKDAFSNCNSLLSLNVSAKDKVILLNAINSGATSVTVDFSNFDGNIDNTTLNISADLMYFELDACGKSFNDLQIVSDAAETVLKDIVVIDTSVDCDETYRVLNISSSDVTLDSINVTTPSVALELTADVVDVKINGYVYLTTTQNEIAMISKNINIDSVDDDRIGIFTISEKYYVNGVIDVNTEMVDMYPLDPESEATLEFDANGGEASFSKRIYKLWEPLAQLPSISRVGYIFDGWYTDKEGGSKIDANSIMNESLHKVYARWTAISYTISFDPNKPTNASSNVQGTTSSNNCIYDQSISISQNGFSLVGWSFQGWATSPNGEVVYADGASVINLTSQAADTIVLYRASRQYQKKP